LCPFFIRLGVRLGVVGVVRATLCRVSSRTIPAAAGLDAFTYTGQMRGVWGGMCHGSGAASWATGPIKTYDGQWKEGMRHGQGIVKWGNGNRYEGHYKENWRHGRGVYKWSDGRRYEGQFKDGMMHGQGVYKYSNGDCVEGRWKKNMKQGPFICTKLNGTRFNRIYKDDVMTSETPIA
jgi:hypothetical protein